MTENESNRFGMKPKIIYLTGFSFMAVSLLVYLFGQANPGMLLIPGAILWLISITAYALAALSMLKRWRIRERSKQLIMFSLCLGYFLWLIAQRIYPISVFIFELEPYLFVADALYIVGYWLMGFSFFSIMKWTRYAGKTKFRILNVLVSFGLAMFVLQTVIIPTMVSMREVSFAGVINLVYSVLDVVLFSLVFGSFLALIGTDLWSDLALIASSFILYLLTDMVFSMLIVNNAYFRGHIIEVFWIIGNMGVALGCFQMGLNAFDFRNFLESKTPVPSRVPLQEKPFSEKLGLDVKGNIILLEFDPVSYYERPVEWFMAEFSPTVIFTHKKNSLYKIAKEMNQKLIAFSEQGSVPKRISETEVVIPAKETSLILDALNEALKTHRNGELNIVFDSLSDLILLLGFEKTYNFLKYALEMLTSGRVTALFLLNSSAHDSKVASSLRSLFSNQLTYGKDRLRVARAIQAERRGKQR